jgi:hypothetical protein
LIFRSFESLGKSGFCQFPGFYPGKTDHETKIGIFDQIENIGQILPNSFWILGTARNN